MKASLLIAVFALLINGCAGLEAKRVVSENQEGFRYFLPQPYLLVTKATAEKPAPSNTQQQQSKTGKKKENKPPAAPGNVPKDQAAATTEDLEYKIIYLPNINEKYAVRILSGIGSVNTNLKMQDGWQLTEVGGTIDTKVPETITAVTGLLKAIPEMAAAFMAKAGERPLVAAEKPKIEPGLYGLKFGSDGLITEIYRIKFNPNQ